MIFDLTASTSEFIKIMALDPNYPQDVTVNIIKGNTTSATFVVEISAHGKPAEYTYQWYVDNQPVSGGNGPSYTISDIADEITHKIFCEVTNKKGTVASRIATLTVTQSYPPTLDDSFPKDATLTIGESVTCEAVIKEAGNPAVYTYQWYKDGNAVSGANSASYSFTPDKSGKTTLYCVVTNSAGTVTSRTATITVKNKFLYEIGDLHTDVTGGWGTSGWTCKYPGTTLKAASIGSTGMNLAGDQGNFGFAGTNNLIDLSNVDTIYVNIAELTNGGRCWIGVNTQKELSVNGQGVYFPAMLECTSAGMKALSVKNMNSGYICVFSNVYSSMNMKCRVTEIRME